MMTIRNLNIKDWSGYFFEEMINILDIYPGCFMVNDSKQCTDSTLIYNICYNDKIGVPHIVFNNIDCYFLKNVEYSSLIFCDHNKTKNIIDIYFKIIKQIRDEVFSFVDEFEDHDFYDIKKKFDHDIKIIIGQNRSFNYQIHYLIH